MDTLVIIPARGNSKGLPGKNIKPLNGKPLILHTIDAAREIFSDAQICISTDSSDIANVVETSGLSVPFLRPDDLATDTASSRSVILHALDFYKDKGIVPRQVILLQPTSPLRKSHHIREAMAIFTPALDMVVSVKQPSANPYFTLFEEDVEGHLHKSKVSNATRRQETPAVWEFNGAIYIFEPETIRQKEFSAFTKIRKYVMDEDSSVDIDTEYDWVVAEYILQNKK